MNELTVATRRFRLSHLSEHTNVFIVQVFAVTRTLTNAVRVTVIHVKMVAPVIICREDSCVSASTDGVDRTVPKISTTVRRGSASTGARVMTVLGPSNVNAHPEKPVSAF